MKAYMGIGIRRIRHQTTLDITFPIIFTKDDKTTFSTVSKAVDAIPSNGYQIIDPTQIQNLLPPSPNTHPYYQTDIILYSLTNRSSPIQTIEEAYFKLHLLSKRFFQPNTLCLDHLFSYLPNIAWTNYGPFLPQDVETEQRNYLFKAQPLIITHVDKLPYLINYHIPSDVRIASGSQVRLGAYLAEGTTVMQAGFVNFNAGSLGPSMIEGRVSAGVTIGAHSHIGGGASIMGTLSGGGKQQITIGKNCLLGANSGTGISLGDDCTIAAGLYIYSGVKVSLYNEEHHPIDLNGNTISEGQNIFKAAALNGRDHMLFIQDSQTGTIICKFNTQKISLNPALHQNT